LLLQALKGNIAISTKNTLQTSFSNCAKTTGEAWKVKILIFGFHFEQNRLKGFEKLSKQIFKALC